MKTLRYCLIGFLLWLPATVEAQNIHVSVEQDSMNSGFSQERVVTKTSRYTPTSYGVDLSLAVGPHFYLGEYDWEAKFRDWWAFPAAEFSATYWLGRVFGFGGTVGYIRYKGLSSPNEGGVFHSPSDQVYKNKEYVRSTGGYMDLSVFGCMDFGNLIGSNPDIIFHLLISMGGGVLVAVQSEKASTGAVFNAALHNQWQITPQWCFDISFKGSFIQDTFDGKSGDGVEGDFPIDGSFGVWVGATYKL